MKKVFIFIFFCYVLLKAYFIRQLWLEESQIDISCFYLALATGCVFCWMVISYAYTKGAFDRSVRTNLLLLLITLTTVAFITEKSLRAYAPTLKSHDEKDGNKYYTSPYRFWMMQCDSCNGRYEYINPPGQICEYKTSEFCYKQKYNAYGLRDAEFSAHKDSNEYRIMAIGDSFVEGIGTSADSTWVKQLEHKLNDVQGRLHYTTLNAGVHSSDLFFSYELLTRCLLKFKPDLLILNLNSTDIYETMIRGDFNRFDSAGNFYRPRGPWWEFAFGSCYMVRLVVLNLFKYDWTLLNPHEYRFGTQKYIDLISRKLNDYYTLSKEQNFTFLLVLQPLQNELPDGENFIKKLKIDPAIKTVNLTGFINYKINVLHQPLNRYYWPKDGHFNGTGYGLEADIIYDQYFAKQ